MAFRVKMVRGALSWGGSLGGVLARLAVSGSVAPAAGTEQRRPANVTVTDAAGKTQSYSGNWICS